MIEWLAKEYEKSSWARFLVLLIPYLGYSIHDNLIEKARRAALSPFGHLWGLSNETVYIVCSQLDKSEARQETEPCEFIYLSKYGDLDALFEVYTSLAKLFPKLDVRHCTSEEFKNFPGNPRASNLILIGGPDYNTIARAFMQYTPFEFVPSKGDVVLRNNTTKEDFKPRFGKRQGVEEVTDYGFFLKIANPYNQSRMVFMISGIDTYGVYGAAKCFLLQDEHEIDVALNNCEKVVSKLGRDPNFSVVLEVKSSDKDIAIPQINVKHLIPLLK